MTICSSATSRGTSSTVNKRMATVRDHTWDLKRTFSIYYKLANERGSCDDRPITLGIEKSWIV
ncbi:hypothetical protein GGI35DRAFT_100672 [Trichoderma velutinum]